MSLMDLKHFWRSLSLLLLVLLCVSWFIKPSIADALVVKTDGSIDYGNPNIWRTCTSSQLPSVNTRTKLLAAATGFNPTDKNVSYIWYVQPGYNAYQNRYTAAVVWTPDKTVNQFTLRQTGTDANNSKIYELKTKNPTGVKAAAVWFSTHDNQWHTFYNGDLSSPAYNGTPDTYNPTWTMRLNQTDPVLNGLASLGDNNTTGACVYAMKNFNFPTGWNGFVPVSSTDVGKTSCNPLDFGCYIAQLGATITDGWNRIIAGIAMLFTPDADSLNATFDDLYNFLKVKLGALLYPFTWLVDFYNKFDWSGRPTPGNDINCHLTSTFLGKPFDIDLCSFYTGHWATSGSPITLLILLLQGAIVIGLLQQLFSKYREVVQNHDN